MFHSIHIFQGWHDFSTKAIHFFCEIHWSDRIAVAGIVSITALVVVPLRMHRAAETVSHEIQDYDEQASLAVASTSSMLSRCQQAIIAFQTTGESENTEAYEKHHAAIMRTLSEAEPLVSKSAPDIRDRFTDLQRAVENWDSTLRRDKLNTVPLEPAAFQRLLFQSSGVLRDAHEAAIAIQQRLHSHIAEGHNDISQSEHRAVAFEEGTIGLGLVTILIGWTTASRRRTASVWLAPQEQALLHDLAGDLSTASKTEVTLNQIAARALELHNAEGAYIEQFDHSRNEITVAAGCGRGIPSIGACRPYEGSWEKEIVEKNGPQILDQGRDNGRARSLLPEDARKCSALLVPFSKNRPVGILVLLRQQAFSADEAAKVRILADLATVSVRHAMLLEETEQRRQEAESARQLRDEVFRIVSHDLTNPINTIHLAANSLQKDNPAKIPHSLDIIRRAVYRMTHLIQDLRDVAVIESGRTLTLNIEIHDVEPILEEVCGAAEYLAHQKSIQLTCRGPENPLFILVDRNRFLQVLTNLLDNAIKFTPPNGRVDLSCESVGTEARFSVSDTGPGIPPEDVDEVFKLYWQGPQTAHLGCGLGLTTAKRIMEQHGGRIWVETQLGTGSTFHVAIPSCSTKGP